MGQDIAIQIDDLRQRKPAACQQLLANYGPMVFRTVQRIVPQRMDAEEIYQDVFVKALRGIGSFDARKSSLATWLCRIAYNESLNFVRGRKPDILSIDDRDWEVEAVDAPDDALQDEQLIRQLERALSMLPAREQAVISMFYYDNMSLADIAFVIGSVPSTVGSRLSRIRKKFYRIIKHLPQ